MPTVDCSPSVGLGQIPGIELVQHGAVISIVIRSFSGQEQVIFALIDSGSQYTCIGDALAQQLQLSAHDHWLIGSVANRQYVDVYLAEIEIPALGIRETTSVLGGLQSDEHRAILGRTQLRDCVLTYDGPRGTVKLSR